MLMKTERLPVYSKMINPKLFILSTDKVQSFSDDYFQKHFPNRFLKSKEFRYADDAVRSLGSAVLLKEVLNIEEKDLSYTKNGKPFVENSKFQFNLSHSGKYCVLSVFDLEIGVDIEFWKDINHNSIKSILTPAEYSFAENNPNKFFDIWTMKESLSKLFGLGLSIGIAKLDVMPIIYDGYVLYGNRKVYGKTLNLDNYSISVCSFKEINKLDLEYF